MLSLLLIGLLASETVRLPAPEITKGIPVERALHSRRSVREFSDKTLEIAQVSQLLWAAQGITEPDGRRTTPSAGALYPLEIYVVVGRVRGLAAGVYRYDPAGHMLEKRSDQDKRSSLSLTEASAVIVIAGVYERTAGKYGSRGKQYVHIEAGSAAENIYLQAVSLGLGTVYMGAFEDKSVQRNLNLRSNEIPLGLMPVGWPK